MNFESLNKMQCTEKYFKKYFSDIYEEIVGLPPIKFQEKIYWYINGITKFPKCPMCGKPVSFLSISKGYRMYCSRACLNSDPNKIERTKQTCLIKYGGVAPGCSKHIQEKAKQTCEERYGTEHALQSHEIQEKIKQTNRKKYGVDWVGSISEAKEKAKQTCEERYGGIGFKSKELKEKAKQTCEERYGDPNYNNYKKSIETQLKRYGGVGNASHILKEKFSQTYRSRIIEDNDFLIGYTDDGGWICKCPHENCNKCNNKTYITYAGIQYDRKKSNTELCTNLLPIQLSHSTNTSIELFVQNILDEIGIYYETNKFILDGQQIDIWLPTKKIGIELNGTFYHSTYFKDPKYHINKFRKAQELGIQLITFWSDQIYNQPDLVKSMILTKLGYCNNTIYARECCVREVSSKESTHFLEANHIQGNTNASYKIGLYYNDILVSLMTFSNKTILQGSKNDNDWKLTRFCSLKNTRVIGAAGKLMNYFIKSQNPKLIVSFSSNDISDGGLYKTLGFISDGKINSSYYYVKGNQRWHRSSFTKSKIVELGWKDKIDGSWTEEDVMREHKYLRIYDSGTTKWEYKV